MCPLSVGRKEGDKRREYEKGRVEEGGGGGGGGGGNGLLQSDFLFLSNFTVAKGLFWFEYEMSVLFSK